MKIILLPSVFLLCFVFTSTQGTVETPTRPPVTVVTPQTDRVVPGKAEKPAIGAKAATNPSDVDYWEDDDDFVPYRSNRHDDFDWQLTKAVFLKDPSNVILSPFSVKLLLALLTEAAGADTETKKQLSIILPNIQTSYQARELYGRVFGSLLKPSTDYNLKLATKMYVDEYITPRQRYAAIIEKNYFTQIESVEFSKARQVTEQINRWVSNVTEGYIENLVKESDVEKSVMLLLNAIYFKGLWRRPFPENQTISFPFYVTPNQQKDADFMVQTGHYYYFESSQLGAKLLRIPYKGKKFAMTIILPNSKGGLDEFVRQLESATLQRIQWLMDEVEVRVMLPKFRMEHTANFNDILMRLGIRDIFTEEASLPLLARGAGLQNRLQVSNVLQKAGLIVDEKGSTVYAATEISLTNKFGDDQVRDFVVNRPFIFTLEDETTGTLLFTGKVTDPTI